MENVLVNRKDDESPINEICFDITKACDFNHKSSTQEKNEFALDEENVKDEI